MAAAKAPSCLKCHRPHHLERGECVDCHGGDPRSERPRVAHHDLIPGRFACFAIPGSPQVEEGKKAMERAGCRRCHTTGGRGMRSAANLDRLPAGTSPQKLFDAIRSPAIFMPEFHFDERQGANVVNAVLAGARQAGSKGGEVPQVVHFEEQGKGKDDIFGKRCGPCHKALTRRFGGLGKGDAGPNLSGLFSIHYPGAVSDKRRWSAAELKRWVENPRKIREKSQMRPVRLQGEEFERIVAVLSDEEEGIGGGRK